MTKKHGKECFEWGGLLITAETPEEAVQLEDFLTAPPSLEERASRVYTLGGSGRNNSLFIRWYPADVILAKLTLERNSL